MFVIRQKILSINNNFKIFEFPKQKAMSSSYHSVFYYKKFLQLHFLSYLTMKISNLEETLINDYNGKKILNKTGSRGEMRFETREDAENVIEFLHSVAVIEKIGS